MSTLNVSNITDGTDTVETGYVVNGSAKVWACHQGASVNGFYQSFNCSTFTDNGTGDYSIAFTSAMNYSRYTAVCSGYSAVGHSHNINQETSTDCHVRPADQNGTALDADGHLVIHGDLA